MFEREGSGWEGHRLLDCCHLTVPERPCLGPAVGWGTTSTRAPALGPGGPRLPWGWSLAHLSPTRTLDSCLCAQHFALCQHRWPAWPAVGSAVPRRGTQSPLDGPCGWPSLQQHVVPGKGVTRWQADVPLCGVEHWPAWPVCPHRDSSCGVQARGLLLLCARALPSAAPWVTNGKRPGLAWPPQGSPLSAPCTLGLGPASPSGRSWLSRVDSLVVRPPRLSEDQVGEHSGDP